MKTHSRYTLAILALGILGLPVPQSFGQDSGERERLSLDRNWRFHLGNASQPAEDFGYGAGELFAKAGDAEGPARPDFADSAWRVVNLPHDWAVELEFVNVKNEALHDHGFKPLGREFPATSIGWYRRTFSVPVSDNGKRLTVQFDGVFRDCRVWLNGHYLGRNLSGYSEFSYDITDYALYGKKNVLVVRVDATEYEGWFYEGAGIYRHVWLTKTAPLHIAPHGTFVSSVVGGSRADIRIETTISNDQPTTATASLRLVIREAGGRIAGRTPSESITLSRFETRTVTQQMRLRNPSLWSPDHPHLYTLVSTLRRRDDVIDGTVTPFGVRTVAFDSDRGFLLNGQRVEIKGVCCHQDHAGVGSALPDRLQEFRIGKLKEMGCNAYRTSHNPPTPELLDACDRLGMLVMDENRLIGSTPEMMDQFSTMILRDRNHPSVIIWSLGNEEWMIQGKDQGRRLALSMKEIQRRLDPTRLCTYAANNGNQYEGINRVVDVRGINYIVLGDPDRYHRDHPGQPVWGSEEASTLCTRGIYANDTPAGYVSDYDVNAPSWGSTAEHWWKFYATRPWLAGAFVWTGFDYRGEPTPYSWPCINSHFGIMDVCGFPKNNFFYYQAWWSDVDVLHLAPHWNWPGREGQQIAVWCQSNCDSVELFLNGTSLGRKVMERNSHLEWKVLYSPGVLEARGWRGGRTLTTKTETTGGPARIRLAPDRSRLHADGEDLGILTVEVLDSRGRVVPTADNLIRFNLTGSGKIIGVGNGNPSSHEPDTMPEAMYQRRLFGGKCQVILQTSRRPGTITVTATGEGLESASATLRAESAVLRPSVN